jgi:hypothetical protein
LSLIFAILKENYGLIREISKLETFLLCHR